MSSCSHVESIDLGGGPEPSSEGCIDCLAIGGQWVHLRRCLACGHVGCCDASPNRHATAHFRSSEHPLIQSFEPGEEWVYCYPDDIAYELEDLPRPSPSHP